jgi:FixJ family two-component response regulator
VPDKLKPMISIVDDDESVREATEAQMKSLGFDAQTFASAADFLASPNIGKTSCLVADIHMPHMTGVELHRRLRDSGYAIPTVLITAYPDDDVRERALADGVKCYLVKPFDEEDLLRCVRLALSDGAR